MLTLKSADRDKFDIDQIRKQYKKQIRKKELFHIFSSIRKTMMSHPELNNKPMYFQQPYQPIYFQLPNNYHQYLTYMLNAPLYYPQVISVQNQPPLQIQQKESNVYLQKNGVVIYNNLLGSGTYSKVWEGKIRQTGQRIAAKQVKKLQPNELKCLNQLTSEYIIKIIDIFTHQQKSFIILEYCDKNLRDQLQSCNYQIQQILKYFQQIIYGIDVLQERNIIHRDLKFENILLKNDTVKIADFGLAKFLGSKLQVESRVCGTPYTMAPQIYFSVSKRAPYTIKSDIWSIGIILHEMLYRIHPFQSDSYEFKQQRRVRIKKRYGILDRIIDKCLVFDPAARISWNQLKQLFTVFLRQKQSYPLKQQQQLNIHQAKMKKKKQKLLEEQISQNHSKQNLPFKNIEEQALIPSNKVKNKAEQQQFIHEQMNNNQEIYKLQNVKQVQSIIYEVPKQERQKIKLKPKQVQIQKQKPIQDIVHIKRDIVKQNYESQPSKVSYLNELIILLIIVASGFYFMR